MATRFHAKAAFCLAGARRSLTLQEQQRRASYGGSTRTGARCERSPTRASDEEAVFCGVPAVLAKMFGAVEHLVRLIQRTSTSHDILQGDPLSC